MTIREKLESRLFNCGMFKDEAKAVVDRLAAQPEHKKSMSKRWDDAVEGYPPQLLAVLWVATKTTALEWIDENCPNAWYRAIIAVKPPEQPQCQCGVCGRIDPDPTTGKRRYKWLHARKCVRCAGNAQNRCYARTKRRARKRATGQQIIGAEDEG